MKEFYEHTRENDSRLSVSRNKPHAYPAHFHLNLEILIVVKGEQEITVSNNKYSAKSGTVVVVDSYEVHSYGNGSHETEETDDCVVILPFNLLKRFNRMRHDLAISTPVINNPELARELVFIVDKYFTEDDVISEAAVGLFLSLLYKHLSFNERHKKDDSTLIRRILSYIKENYTGDVSRPKIAHALGYTEAHISRTFHKYIGKSISEYVNDLRLKLVRRRISEGEKPSTDLILDCGFGSLQTYYRVKAKSIE